MGIPPWCIKLRLPLLGLVVTTCVLLVLYNFQNHLMWLPRFTQNIQRSYTGNNTVTVLEFTNNTIITFDTTNKTNKTVAIVPKPTEKFIISVINPHDFDYIIFNNDVCVSPGRLTLVVVVCTATSRFVQRRTIRETWGSDTQNDSLKTRLIFLLGKTEKINEQIELIRENNVYHDIIQEDFEDSYKNLSLKSVAMLKWVKEYCSQADYVMKADDDMYINLPNAVKDLQNRKDNRFIMGMVNRFTIPTTDKKSKWFSPDYTSQNYPDFFSPGTRKHYPVYVSGTAYIISGDIASDLYQASLVTKFFWLEDVYITGMLAFKISARHIHNAKYTYAKRAPDGCAHRNSISSHRHSVTEINKIWADMQNSSIKC